MTHSPPPTPPPGDRNPPPPPPPPPKKSAIGFPKGGIPRLQRGAYEIETRRSKGWLFRWEGRVVEPRRWHPEDVEGSKWIREHVHPRIPYARGYGSEAVWKPGLTQERLRSSLRRWIEREYAEQRRQTTIERTVVSMEGD